MFNDMALSSDINEKFKEYLEQKSLSNGGVDFNILILTAVSWPLAGQSSTFNVPQEVRHSKARHCFLRLSLPNSLSLP